MYLCICVFVCTLPPFLPWPLIPFVKLTDRAPGTQITLRVSSGILRYTNIYKICRKGGFLDIWVTFSRSCGEYLPQISPQLALFKTIQDKKNVSKKIIKMNICHSIKGIFWIVWPLKDIPSERISPNVFLQIYSCGKCGKAGWCYPLGKIKLRINLNSLEAISVSNGY